MKYFIILFLNSLLAFSASDEILNCAQSFNSIENQTLNDIEKVLNIQATQQLFAAVDNCQVKKIKKALASGANPNANNQVYNQQVNRFTPLILAVRRKCPQAVQLLVEAGADINFKRAIDKNTALMIASRRGDLESIEILLAQEKIDINATSSMGRTAIIIASTHDQPKIIAQLLKNKKINLSLSSLTDSSATAIGIAARQNNLKSLELLVNHSDEIKPITFQELKGAYIKARYNKHQKAVELLDLYKNRFYPDEEI